MTIVSRRGLVFKRQIRYSFSSSVAADGVVLKKGADLKKYTGGETNRNVSNNSQVK
jgi:hypothetical protein